MNLEKNLDPGKEFEKELRAVLESESFELPDENWENIKDYAMKVMESNSINSLNCDVKTHNTIVNALLEGKNKFNLFNISFLLNGFNLTTPKDLGIDAANYNRICFYVDVVMKSWNKKVDPIKSKIANKIKTRMNLGAPNAGKFVNPNLRRK